MFCLYRWGLEYIHYVSHREENQPLNWKLNVKYNISYFIIHKNYPSKNYYDIGMVKLKSPVNDIVNADIPILNTTPISDYGYNYHPKLYGGGRMENDQRTDHLREMDLEFHPSRDLNCRFRKTLFCYKAIRDISSKNSPVTSYGDSGAPIVLIKNEDGTSRTYLLGLHSGRIPFKRSRLHNRESIGFAVDVFYFKPWINTIITEFSPAVGPPLKRVYTCCQVLAD